MAEIICAIFTGILSILCYVYVLFAAREKGPILSNTYLFASDEEKERFASDEMKNLIKAEYHMVSIVFTFLGTIFAFLTVFLLTEWKWCLYLTLILAACVLIYAVKESIKTEMNR